MHRKFYVTLTAAACLLLSFPTYAYIDPGTGSIILQGLLGGIAVALGIARMYWERLKSLFVRIEPNSENLEREDREEQSST